jgi:hypothetical protein
MSRSASCSNRKKNVEYFPELFTPITYHLSLPLVLRFRRPIKLSISLGSVDKYARIEAIRRQFLDNDPNMNGRLLPNSYKFAIMPRYL